MQAGEGSWEGGSRLEVRAAKTRSSISAPPQKVFPSFFAAVPKPRGNLSSSSKPALLSCRQDDRRRPSRFRVRSARSTEARSSFFLLSSTLSPPSVSLYLVNPASPCVSRLLPAIADPLLPVLFSIQPKPRSTRFAPSFRPQLLPSSLPSHHHPTSSTLFAD